MKKKSLLLQIVGIVAVVGSLGFSSVMAAKPASAQIVSRQEQVAAFAKYQPVEELKSILNKDAKLKALVEKSIAAAAKINPDRSTNPAQTLDEFYEFIDYSLTCMPWNILPPDRYNSFAAKCDQSILYAYFLLDQPLPELEQEKLFYPSVEYLSPIYEWLTRYNNKWRVYLETPASWKDEYYAMLAKDSTWNLDKGWYENKDNWHSFNDFFSRKLSSSAARPVASPNDEQVVTAPADSLPQGVWQISKKGLFLADSIKNEEGVIIKASTYVSVEEMLGKEGAKYARKFHNGVLTHTYLNYDDYHRYHAPVGGTVKAVYVVPYANAVGGVIYWDPKTKLYVLESNSLSWQSHQTRGCVIIDTGKYGLVAVLPVGMGQVSSVNFLDRIKPGMKISKGDELGYFLFGGSDCVILFEKKANFRLTAAKNENVSGYSNGYAHVLCNAEYGRIGK